MAAKSEAPSANVIPSAEQPSRPVYEANGTVRLRTAEVLSGDTQSYVRELRAQAGDQVHTGQVLAVVETRERGAERAAQITAPCDGLVTERRAESGALEQPGATLFTIEAASYRLEVPIEESLRSMIGAGYPVSVYLDAVDKPIKVRVTEVAHDPLKRAFMARIDLPPVSLLRSGMFGHAVFELGQQEVQASANVPGDSSAR